MLNRGVILGLITLVVLVVMLITIAMSPPFKQSPVDYYNTLQPQTHSSR
jgi:hypothetical protein